MASISNNLQDQNVSNQSWTTQASNFCSKNKYTISSLAGAAVFILGSACSLPIALTILATASLLGHKIDNLESQTNQQEQTIENHNQHLISKREFLAKSKEIREQDNSQEVKDLLQAHDKIIENNMTALKQNLTQQDEQFQARLATRKQRQAEKKDKEEAKSIQQEIEQLPKDVEALTPGLLTGKLNIGPNQENEQTTTSKIKKPQIFVNKTNIESSTNNENGLETQKNYIEKPHNNKK